MSLHNPITATYSYDPYDLWATESGLTIRRLFYDGCLRGKAGAALIAAADWLCPAMTRKLAGVVKAIHPITAAHLVLLDTVLNSDQPSFNILKNPIDVLADLAAWNGRETAGWGWGLGFPWMSKNGLYSPDTPFVTHTPYVMEALLAIAAKSEFNSRAMEMFYGTRGFLDALLIMYQDPDKLALSYAPVEEPRIVVNANAYAAFAYALHAAHGMDDDKPSAKQKAVAISKWVALNQHENGCWNYYSDDLPGNFIDCFHSCFIIKNLFKTVQILPETNLFLMPAIEKGFDFILKHFPDPIEGLCRRFLERDIKDPYQWDIYDQAEFLGVLIDFGHIDKAIAFRSLVEERFKEKSTWWCRIDCLGRHWGKEFLRWGIVPFWYQSARLDNAITNLRGTGT